MMRPDTRREQLSSKERGRTRKLRRAEPLLSMLCRKVLLTPIKLLLTFYREKKTWTWLMEELDKTTNEPIEKKESL